MNASKRKNQAERPGQKHYEEIQNGKSNTLTQPTHFLNYQSVISCAVEPVAGFCWTIVASTASTASGSSDPSGYS